MNKLYKYDSERMECDEIYKRALNGANYAIWEWNMDTSEIFISEKTKEIIGNNFLNVKTMPEFINSIAYEEDKALAINDLYDYINGKKSFYQSTFRIKNKKLKWVLFKGKILKTETECFRVFSGIMSEVNQHKLIENWDTLTNIPNRIFLLKKLYNSIKVAKFCNKKGVFIYINIDNFRSLNTAFGHNFGDLILIIFTQTITRLLNNNGEIGRLGGDEFGILIHEFNTIRDVKKICHKIHECLKNPFKIMNHEIYITISMGLVVFPQHSSDIYELLKFSNFAMNNSKYKGKNQYTFFHKKIFDIYYRKILIENELKDSIDNDELEIYYQPQIDVSNNRMVGIESLLRWNNKKLGSIPPGEFIPIIENNGYIIKIGNWVLDKVIYTIHKWKEKGYKIDRVAVNISPVQLRTKDFKANLLNMCTKYNISPSLLELEITEGTLLEICKDNIKIFNELIESNINIALDDFGSKYSSLSYLVALPINTLKIDKLFVDNIQNEKNKIVIKSMADLSRALNCKIIIEGVETKEQVDILNDLGCNIIQGYYFSKPLSEKEFENLLTNSR
ncbi:putative bifunctional diguanylate cyclase/phosphodiesterase [Clostridium sp. WILCCON 0269]|uniref:Bifunctional diguanylate cyclase/phosphodiesterase n=1 Tax=Candidatus Clostridium eludens TaxID=3381663 RepID=A0ABW8SSF6_9CLOT